MTDKTQLIKCFNYRLLAHLAVLFNILSISSSLGNQIEKRFRPMGFNGGPYSWIGSSEGPMTSYFAGIKDKRNYVDLQCRGMYDQGMFAQLDRICEDCYNLYKDAEVHGFCRSDCFSSHTFKQCLQSLLLEKESEFYLEMVEIIGKRRKKIRRIS
ncbi:unnamed protein product [Lepeophtheirus salmonis]|uniref:(salmon louse) hypothetical protein n=1 Tax=Lepeophtheirus salmonis TaxID=72036 RepID=A0A7R8D4P7_LEPSM|nr:unnamed protein product [Lepeophtheirus salmonis]CAF2974077.1 unnamed protein product [Lepeophtheirus salmonis]